MLHSHTTHTTKHALCCSRSLRTVKCTRSHCTGRRSERSERGSPCPHLVHTHAQTLRSCFPRLLQLSIATCGDGGWLACVCSYNIKRTHICIFDIHTQGGGGDDGCSDQRWQRPLFRRSPLGNSVTSERERVHAVIRDWPRLGRCICLCEQSCSM